jgi:hypothetical protein
LEYKPAGILNRVNDRSKFLAFKNYERMLIADYGSTASSYKQKYNVIAISRVGSNVRALVFSWYREVHDICTIGITV